MNSKFLSKALCIVLILSLISIGNFKIAKAELTTAVRATERITDADKKILSLSYAKLKSGAVPLPSQCIGELRDDLGVNHKILDHYDTFPEDGKVYYIKDFDGSESFFKFAFLNSYRPNYVCYVIYYWVKMTNGHFAGDMTCSEYYNPSLAAEVNAKIQEIKDNTPSGKNYTTKRIGGNDNIDTAAIIANEIYSGKVDNVVITTESDFPDALASTTLAQKLNAPILYVSNNLSDNKPTLDYITNHLNSTGTVYIIGGQGAVSDSVADSIKSCGVYNFKRISGNDRYETAGAICSYLSVPKYTSIALVTGDNYPDALSISPVAAKYGYPILLTNKNNIPDATLELIKQIQPAYIYIIGGTGVISQSVEDYLEQNTESAVWREAGADRYNTSINIDVEFRYKQKTDTIFFASGKNFTTALAGSLLASKLGCSIILADNDNYEEEKSYVDSLKDITNEYFLGNNNEISDRTIKLLSR